MLSFKDAPDGHAEFEAWHHARHPEAVAGCYACKVSTVQLQFTYGKESFHGPTLNERIDLQLKEGKAAGLDLVPQQRGCWT